MGGDLPHQRADRVVRDPVGKSDPAPPRPRQGPGVRHQGCRALGDLALRAPPRPQRRPAMGLDQPGDQWPSWWLSWSWVPPSSSSSAARIQPHDRPGAVPDPALPRPAWPAWSPRFAGLFTATFPLRSFSPQGSRVLAHRGRLLLTPCRSRWPSSRVQPAPPRTASARAPWRARHGHHGGRAPDLTQLPVTFAGSPDLVWRLMPPRPGPGPVP